MQLRLIVNQHSTCKYYYAIAMWYVYILTSQKKSNWIYVGFTSNLRRRLLEHTTGRSPATKGSLPVDLNSYIAVKSKRKAFELEKYLKVGSGKAILKKRIIVR